MRQLQAAIEEALKTIPLEATLLQRQQLLEYLLLILEGLQSQRLVGEKSEPAIINKHLVDSLFPLSVLHFAGGKMLDLGTGAGLPGIPLKIFLPWCPLYLLDANQRKIAFLRRAVKQLALPETYFLEGRAEEWGRRPGYREGFRYIVSRAVAKTAVLAELALPLTEAGGQVIFYKGPQGLVEDSQAAGALAACGGVREQYWFYCLPTGEQRSLFLYRKQSPTPPVYPRRVGIPAKRPLGI